MKIGRRKRCGKCRSCGKTKRRFSHSSLDLRSTLPTTPAAAVLPQTQLSFYSPEFFQALNAARVVFEVGTHSAWVQEVICGCGHEVLVATPQLMEGSKRRKRKNDRIDANKLARLGRVDPQSLHPMRHRSKEVRQDLVVLRARDALVA